MTEISINGSTVKVEDGATILDAASQLGIEIPTMCHMKDREHFTSCMVCMVEEKSSGRLLPSCSAMAQDGMVIETESDKAVESRRTALELLLSDHVGDCDAPCYRVCPKKIDIPRMIRQIAEGKKQEAAQTVISTAGSNPCYECTGQCEKACRRKLHDGSVSIKMLVQFALQAASGSEDNNCPEEPAKQFNCNMGKLLEGEMERFLENASSDTPTQPANGESFTEEEARKEAQRCLHCDCRKRTDCKLRKYSTLHNAKQRKYSIGGRKPFIQIRQHADVVYEPEKCIKCGTCVRITESGAEQLGLTFIGRGFDVKVGAPMNETLDNALKTTATECVEQCPTAALSFSRD